MIESFAALLDESLKSRSGKAFYSGRAAFSRAASLYILGVNPGGDPGVHAKETIGGHTDRVLREFDDQWSEYCDASWLNLLPGTAKLQRRVLHMLNSLGLNVREVPASNLIFVRSQRAENLRAEMRSLAERCWPFHAAAVEALRPGVVLCMGKEVGKYVRERLEADSGAIDSFVERNDRGWRSEAHLCPDGRAIVTVTHPAIVDWTALATDPTPLVRRMMQRTSRV